MLSYAVTVFDGPLQRAERPTPQPTGTEVLVKIEAAGVCHSDLHICEGFYDLGGGKKLTLADRGVALPLVMGHEIAGEIVSAGPDSAPVKTGEKVVVHPWIGCGHCAACKRDEENLCIKPRFLGVFVDGGYSTHVLAPHARYCLPTGGLSPQIAAPYACSGLTTFSALNKIDRAKLTSEPIIVIGAGGLGLMCLTLMKAMSAKGAIVVDTDETKRDAAMAAGAIAFVHGGAADAAAQVRALTPDGQGAIAAIDLVGARPSLQLAIDSTTKGGKIVVVGLIGGEITMPIPVLPQRALTIQGSYVGSLPEMKALMALVASGKVPPMPVSALPLDKANDALAALKAGKVVGRLVLTP